MSIVSLDHLILTIRGEKVILDTELARLYGVPVKRLNEQVKRNADRFPEDFAFRLTEVEYENLKSQNATSSSEHGGRRKKPNVFTEHGAVMAASVLNSPEAVSMSVFVVRAFVDLRRKIAANEEIIRRIKEIDQTILDHEKKFMENDEVLRSFWAQLKPLLESPMPKRNPIGFQQVQKK